MDHEWRAGGFELGGFSCFDPRQVRGMEESTGQGGRYEKKLEVGIERDFDQSCCLHQAYGQGETA